MSETYELCCDKCRVRVWVGQSRNRDTDSFYLYHAPDRRWFPAEVFLRQHAGHPVRLLSDRIAVEQGTDLDWEEYTELDQDSPDLDQDSPDLVPRQRDQ